MLTQMLPGPARGDVLHGKYHARLKRAADGAFQIMQTHHVLRRIVQHHAEIVEIQEPAQSCRQVLEQVGQIAVRGNRRRHVE